jgi:hypothetical protein
MISISPDPPVRCRTRAKSSRRCRRQSAEIHFHNRQCCRTSLYFGPMLARDPETRHEVFVTFVRSAVLESYPNHLVACRLRPVPRPLKRYESIPAIFRRELLPLVKTPCPKPRSAPGPVRREPLSFDLVQRTIRKTQLRIGTNIRVGLATFWRKIEGPWPFRRID